MPIVQMAPSARGLPASGTLAGPPDRISAFGCQAASLSASALNGQTSQ